MELPVQRWLLSLDVKRFLHLTLKLRLALVDDIEILVAECSTFVQHSARTIILMNLSKGKLTDEI